ncbi:MAG: type VI secretion system baseplate subunit TssE [Pseudomonadota bacterium]
MRKPSEVTSPDLRGPRRQMSLMHVFRTTAEKGDARVPPNTDTIEDPTEQARRARRTGIDEAELRRHLALDLESLISTIRLDAIADLDPGSRISRSVINHGFADLSRAGGTVASRIEIAQAIRTSLIDFEPRLIPRSVDVQMAEEDEASQRLSFQVTAEIAADPADLPLEFLAEVDLGSGKLKTKRLRLQR